MKLAFCQYNIHHQQLKAKSCRCIHWCLPLAIFSCCCWEEKPIQWDISPKEDLRFFRWFFSRFCSMMMAISLLCLGRCPISFFFHFHHCVHHCSSLIHFVKHSFDRLLFYTPLTCHFSSRFTAIIKWLNATKCRFL